MPLNSRSKGAHGEREAAILLMTWGRSFGYDLTIERNLEQTRRGGADLDGVPMLTIEVKRQETLNVKAWWKQTLKAAYTNNEVPLLMYRLNRRGWFFMTNLTLTSGPVTVTMDELNGRSWFRSHLDHFCGDLRIAS